MADNANTMASLQKLVDRFIRLANEIKDEGKPVEMVNAALMSASCAYATYTAVGNEGYLKPGGVEKITAIYQRNLASLQDAKQKQLNPEGES